eukprot:m.139653 g.139653  ORF g.139653 m.139653 type:complete len:515 (+) comp14804_c2_seq1:145-1689(+)
MHFIFLFALVVSAARPAVQDSKCSMNIFPNQRTFLNDIRNVTAVDVADCCQACQSEPQCKYFEYVIPKKRCWLKTSGMGGHSHDPTCVSGGIQNASQCTNDLDCNYCGTCKDGKCVCDPGFTGEQCEVLNLGNPLPCGKGGLCLKGQEVESNSGATPTSFFASWGGAVVKGDDNKWHMYASSFQYNASLMGNNGSAGWITNSDVLHAVSSTPEGPYVASDIALGPRGRIYRQPNCTLKPGVPGIVCDVIQADDFWDSATAHTPAAQRGPNGEYLIWYMGTSMARNSTNKVPCLDNSNPPKPTIHAGSPVCKQRIGLAVSMKPEGPWMRYDSQGKHGVLDNSTFILGPGPVGDFDSAFANNPTPLVLANGSVILVYKGREAQCPGCGEMRTGVALANGWNETYHKLEGITPMPVQGNCEDAAIYRAPSGVYRVVFHCGCSYQIAWSLDGLHYNVTTAQQPWCDVTYSDGTNETLKRRERPQWVLGEDGHPTHLMTGVLPSTSHEGLVWTMAAPLL